MHRLYPLDNATKLGVIYLADIHLRPSLLNAQKILSDAFHIANAGKIAKIENLKKEISFWAGNAQLLPPTGTPSVWAQWAARKRFNAWWIVDHAYQLSSEFDHRFYRETPQQEYLKIQEWITTHNLMSTLPKEVAKGETQVYDPLPIVIKGDLPVDWQNKTPIQIYRDYYATLKGKVRMRWTRRTLPPFFGDIPF